MRRREADRADRDHRRHRAAALRDVTPEATRAVLEREIPAIPVAMWVEGLKITPQAMLSRAVAGTRGSSLILNLPGSEKAARENLSAVIGALEHAMHMIAAEGHG